MKITFKKKLIHTLFIAALVFMQGAQAKSDIFQYAKDKVTALAFYCLKGYGKAIGVCITGAMVPGSLAAAYTEWKKYSNAEEEGAHGKTYRHLAGFTACLAASGLAAYTAYTIYHYDFANG